MGFDLYEGQDYSVRQWTANLENWVKFIGATYVCEFGLYVKISGIK